MIPSKERLEEIIKELQRIMRIQDWDIDIEVLSKQKYEAAGYGEGQAHNRIIRVLNKSLISINKDLTSDWYKSLLHELIHLAFDPMEQAGINACNLTTGNASKCIDDNYMVAMERTVEKFAGILASVYPVTNFIDKEGD